MAILSNINGKFAVDSTGAIQFSGAAGTSGYVLKSTGSGAAPTWVDPSTVIGGPYLPLTGGTLTGATATASGISFTVGGTLTGTTATFAGTINGSGVELSNYMQIKVDDAEIYWTNTANNDYWRWKRDASNNFICDHYNGTSTAAALTFNSSQNATFTGDIQAPGIYVGSTNASFDFYNNGTSYFNGTVTVDAAFTQSGGDASTFSGNVGIGITSPNTKLDVSGTTGTRNRNTQGSSVYETSLYFVAAGNATTNVSIDTTTAFPPIASGGFILVEVSASGYGSSGSNGLVFSYISGGYGGHYGGQGQAYHPVEIIANTMQAGSCTFYYPNWYTVGIAVTTTNSAGLNGLMRVKVTTTY